jgi:hypothetical protein
MDRATHSSPDSDKFVDALHTAAYKLANDTGRMPTELLINARVLEHIIYRSTRRIVRVQIGVHARRSAA